MHPAADLALTVSRQLQENFVPRDLPKQTTQPDHVMARFWSRMSEAYGHKWVRQFGPEPTETWAAGLGHLTVDQIATGLREVARRGDEWPPNLIQFRGMCRPSRENEAMYRFTPLRLEHKRTDAQVSEGRKKLEEIRKLLK